MSAEVYTSSSRPPGPGAAATPRAAGPVHVEAEVVAVEEEVGVASAGVTGLELPEAG